MVDTRTSLGKVTKRDGEERLSDPTLERVPTGQGFRR